MYTEIQRSALSIVRGGSQCQNIWVLTYSTNMWLVQHGKGLHQYLTAHSKFKVQRS